MNELRKYPRCNLKGTGELILEANEKEYKFKIVDISAEGIKMLMEEEIEEDQNVTVNIHLVNYIFEVNIDAKGISIRSEKVGSFYKCVVGFTKMHESDRNEINELIMSSCNLI